MTHLHPVRLTIVGIAMLLAASLVPAHGAEPTNPNVLLLMVDELNSWLLGDTNRYAGKVVARIGRVLDALESSDYRDNTIVILMSDHGFHLGEKHHWQKSGAVCGSRSYLFVLSRRYGPKPPMPVCTMPR